MKLKPLRKPIYNIGVVVFLVIALSLISIITSITNKNSDELSVVVANLSQNRLEIDKLDEAIQLLYDAENNSRLYVLIRDLDIYTTYLNQLTKVSLLITSIQKDDEKQIEELVADKRLKTELYINARLLADSLIQHNPIIESSKGSIATIGSGLVKSISNDTVSSNKIIEEYLVANKSEKGLFGRIRDAIINRPIEDKVRNVTIVESPETVGLKPENLAEPIQNLLNTRQQNNQSVFSKLSEKERALLTANEVLFQELKNVLQRLKNENLEIQRQRQLNLGNDATELVNDLKSNNNYSLILSLVLTFVILGVLLLLYKNMQALQKAKLEAESYAKYKGQFIATLSHEIRTPLHSIHAFTDELSRTNKKEGESEIIDAIKLSSNMLISVVNNILDFTKMESGKFKLNYTPFIPSVVILEVISGLTIQANRKSLLIVNRVDSSVGIKVYGDAFQFRQLLVNIISNAIKYTEKGSITVSAVFRTTDHITGLLEVAVKDTGIGIERERLLHVFDEYNSNNNSLEIKEGSTGLGLSIVKKIIDYHKGKIKVGSEVGVGTLFEIELPYDIYLEKNKEPILILSDHDRTTRKILIVENDQLNIKILSLLFTNENYIVYNSYDGVEALDKYLNNDFDLIITDISMPKLSGLELARKIRELADPKKSLIPILVISGYAPPEDFQINGKSDITAWIVKPFDLKTLLLKVEELFEEYHKTSHAGPEND